MCYDGEFASKITPAGRQSRGGTALLLGRLHSGSVFRGEPYHIDTIFNIRRAISIWVPRSPSTSWMTGPS